MAKRRKVDDQDSDDEDFQVDPAPVPKATWTPSIPKASTGEHMDWLILTDLRQKAKTLVFSSQCKQSAGPFVLTLDSTSHNLGFSTSLRPPVSRTKDLWHQKLDQTHMVLADDLPVQR